MEDRMALRATEVFVPGAYPPHTYVERATEGFEQALANAIATPGQIVSLSGPSKSGKTVLVERVVTRDLLIPVSGVSIKQPDDIWDRVLDWMDVPDSTTHARTIGANVGAELAGTGQISVPTLVKVGGTASAKAEVLTSSNNEAVRERSGMAQVIREIANSDFVILLDDFHYMDRTVQVEVAKYLKEAARHGVKIITAAVSHRGDDVVRALPELRGRVRSIDLRYWDLGELRAIADRGFNVLNAVVPNSVTETFTTESAGSPQLMQQMCLQACFVLGLNEKALLKGNLAVEPAILRTILEQTSANTDFRSLVDVLDAGPRTRGTERKTYKFRDGGEGDVYRCIMKAVAADPPRLAFAYDELLERTVRVCSSESPVGSSVTGTCLHMSRLARHKFPNERAIDWDEEKQAFDLPDPYLLFYLRWSGRLNEA
jgi:hypothetical protein